jgi:F0F1-type ATP synthase assembly protein I
LGHQRLVGDASVSEQPASQQREDQPGHEQRRREGMEFADASLWVSRIFSAIVPGLIGLWLDDRYGTRYFALIGLVLGLVSGILHFVQATKGVFKQPVVRSGDQSSPNQKSPPGRTLP